MAKVKYGYKVVYETEQGELLSLFRQSVSIAFRHLVRSLQVWRCAYVETRRSKKTPYGTLWFWTSTSIYGVLRRQVPLGTVRASRVRLLKRYL